MLYTGQPCNEHGDYLPPGSPPTPPTDDKPDEWTPFHDRMEFETGEFLFTCNQMSAGDINTLLDLWAASLFKHHDHPPFADHDDLYTMIDLIPHGDVAWDCFTTSYQGDKPATDVPAWMNAEYDVWFRDPRTVVRNMLANPGFDGEIDYAPLRDFDASDKRQFQDFMSGDWAWKQAVTYSTMRYL